MISNRREKIKNIFNAASELEISKRADFLQKVCGSDVELRIEIEKLLASFDDASSFMENPAVGEVASLIIEKDGKLESGQQLGFYEIISEIGAGGMGEVYLAKDLRLNRQAALKILPADLTDDEARLKRFQLEARTASSLNHPNIITIYEIGNYKKTNYIAAEFVEGETLRKKISQRKFDFFEVLDAAIQIVSGLAVAHKANVVHRDIKPENIMIRPDKIVKILDFGLAKLQKKDEESFASNVLTTPGMIIGTVNYMSPEQAAGAEIDNRTDLWSFGVCLYEMLTGRLPFAGKTVNHKLVAIMENDPEPINLKNSPAFDEIEKIIYKLLEKSPENRYQTADVLLEDLRRIRKNLRIAPENDDFIYEEKSQNTADLQNRPTVDKTSEKTLISKSEVPSNLPKNRTPIIGREKEIGQIIELLENERLVTLKGIGGTGKTRLASEIAYRITGEFADGVFFISLADIKNSELVISEIAKPFELKETAENPIGDVLKKFLELKKLLFVIDNFEQVIDAAAGLSALLDAAPNLKILVTSRALLKIEAEREFAVPPLDLPTDTENKTPEKLFEYESIKLFVERAKAVKKDFTMTTENAASIAEICAGLEGLPLAIELAAARIKILSPKQIAVRLEKRLQILSSGARDLPTRQQTMYGAIEWSYELLDSAEKLLFRRLAVFVGGFTVEAVEAVFDNGEILDHFTSLLENSLLVLMHSKFDEPRFRLLEIVREFAFEKLEKSGELREIKEKHAAYFLSLARQADSKMFGREGSKWLDLLDENHENIRAVMEWSKENDVKTLVKIAAAIRDFWVIRNHLSDGRKWLETAFENRNSATDEEAGKISGGLGQTAKFQGDLETARKAFEKALEIGEKTNNIKQIAVSIRGLAMTAKNQGDYSQAKKYSEKSLKISRETGDKFGIAVSVNTLGELARIENNFAAARVFYEEALEICRELKNEQGINCGLNNLGAVAFGENDFPASKFFYTEALKIGEKSGEKVTLSYTLDGFAALALKTADFEKAAKLAGAAENLRESVGYKIEPAESIFREAYLVELKAVLIDDFAGFYEQGKSLDINKVVALISA